MGDSKRRGSAVLAALAMALGVGAALSAPAQATAGAPAQAQAKGFDTPTPPQEYERQMRATGEEQRVLAEAAAADKLPPKGHKGVPRMRPRAQGKASSTSGQGGGSSALTACASPCFFYNGFGQSFTADPADAAAVDMTIGKPYVDNSVLAATHSLGELAVQSANGNDVVEFGWIVDKTMRADGNPILFAYHWINGVPKGYNVAFVDYAPNPINLGAGLPKPVNKKFSITQTSTAWWVYYDTDFVGYVPKSRWTPGGVVQPFNAAAAQIYTVQPFFGVAVHETEPCTDMAAGTMYDATGSPTPPVSTISNYVLSGTTIAANLATVNGDPGTPGVWGAAQDTATSGRAGGPGHNSAGTGGGTFNAC